jgi:cardiolipin synthase
VNEVDILATGTDFIKAGARGIQPVTEETVRHARREVQVLAYVLTPEALSLLDLIESAAERGVKVSIIVNGLDGQPSVIKSKLRRLVEMFPYVRVSSFENEDGGQLHAKIIIVDREAAIVGSANLTWRGMFSNYEIAILVRGDAAWKLATIFDSLAVRLASRKKL